MNIFRFSNYLTPSGLASVAISNKQTNFDIPLCAINIVSVFIQLLTLCKLANSSFFPPPSKVHQGNTSLCTYRYLHGSASQLGSVSQLLGKFISFFCMKKKQIAYDKFKFSVKSFHTQFLKLSMFEASEALHKVEGTKKI